MNKPFFASKINLLGILSAIAGAASLADLLPPDLAKYVLLVSGIAAVILRTFYTTEAK